VEKYMKHTKKILLLVATSLFLTPLLQPILADNTTDTFDITVTGEFLWIDITNASWAIGDVTYSTSTWTNETGSTFIADIDNCTVNTDVKLQITGAATDWSDGSSPTADTYRLNASSDDWSTEINVQSSAEQVVQSDVTEGQNCTFDLRFDSPTTSSTGDQQTITITATVQKH
jgi:hypothetical protein